MTDTGQLIRQIVDFRDERDWGQFHKLRHRAAMLSVEAGELRKVVLGLDEREGGARCAVFSQPGTSRSMSLPLPPR